MRIVPLLVLVAFTSCARRVRPGGPTERELLAAALTQFATAAPQTAETTLWLTDEDDSECDRVDGAQPRKPRDMAIEALAWEVFQNQIVATRWAAVVEGHRHNYARDLKPETHRTVTTKSEAVSSVEDLCLLDEAKKRAVDKVLVYQVLGVARGSVLVHLRLSNARTGVVEVSRTLLATGQGVVDRSVQ